MQPPDPVHGPPRAARVDAVCPHCHRHSADHPADFRRRADERGLTAREAEVVELIGRGVTNKEIVEWLGLSANTVKSYIRKADRRIEVETRSQAVIWANGFDVDRTDRPSEHGA